MIRVLVVDDQELVRRGFRMILDTLDEVTVVAEASHGREALALINRDRPDVVLSDARMPVMDGVELVKACRATYPEVPVIVLTTFDDDDLVRAAMRAGAAGFILKDSSTEELGRAIEAVQAGGMVVDPRVARALLADAGGPGTEDPLAVLTRTERRVAAEVACGASNAEIAATMVLAEGTVKNHVSALLRKLGHRDRTALALALSRVIDPDRDEE